MDRDNRRSWVRVQVLIDYRFALALAILGISIWLLIK